MAALRILAGGAAQSLVEKAHPGFEIDGTFSAVGAMRDRLLAGEPADIVILSRALVEELALGGHVVRPSITDVARVATAVAVRSGDPLPAIGDKAGLAAALEAADEIHFPDPAQATAGIHFAKVMRELGVWVSAPAGNHKFTKGISWPACQPNCFAVGAVRPGKDEVYLDRSAKIDLVVPAAATSSSNAILCGSVLLLREAIEKAGYDWKKDGATLPDAMMAIFQRTGVPVRDPGSDRTFTAGKVGDMRLREVEIHHADLDLAYTCDDWPSAFSIALLDNRAKVADGASLTAYAADLDRSWTVANVGVVAFLQDPETMRIYGAAHGVR